MRNEDTFANFKDQIELLKVLALGTGMCTASYVVAASELGSLTRAVGAMTCITLGVWIGVCGVIVYFRNRLDLSGLSAGQKVWRIAQYLIVMCATLFAFSTAIELAKLKGPRAQPRAAAIELPTLGTGIRPTSPATLLAHEGRATADATHLRCHGDLRKRP